MGRFGTAWRAFWGILGSAEKAARWRRADGAGVPPAAAAPAAPAAATSDALSADAVYTLVLLQREGRLIDFLQEDISQCSDAQVGAAARQVHANCRLVLARNFGIAPVYGEREGARVRVGPDSDPRQVRVVGDAGREPPFEGTLRHHGWRVTKVEFPARHAKLDASIICPAEVEA